MLAFDIETEGLDPLQHRIIVASVYDPDRNIQRTFNFMADPAMYESERQELIRHLDEADSLCSFNGVRFDLPFICRRFGVPDAQHGRWVLKTLDYFEICKLCFGSSCSLKNLLAANGHEAKSSSGLQAIEWAREGRWKEVEDYCMRDAILTHGICCRGSAEKAVRLPLTGWSHPVDCRLDFAAGADRAAGSTHPRVRFV